MILITTKRMYSIASISLSLLTVACAGVGGSSFGSQNSPDSRNIEANKSRTIFDRMTLLEKKNIELQKDLKLANSRFSTLSNRFLEFEQKQQVLAGEVDNITAKTDELYPSIEERLTKQEGEIAILKANATNSNIAIKPAQGKQEITNEPIPDASELYKTGLDAFRKRKYSLAINSFNALIKNYPKAKLIDNAYFWLGESYYQSLDYKSSVFQYEKVIKNFPKSHKLPASYLKQGLAFVQLKNINVARIRLNTVIEKFPKSSEAKRAKLELKKIAKK